MPKDSMFWFLPSIQATGIGGEVHPSSSGQRTNNYFHSTPYQFPVIFDTGTSAIFTPKSNSKALVLRLTASKTVKLDSDGIFSVDCGQKSFYPDICFMINGS
jgi:hypothetical protein